MARGRWPSFPSIPGLSPRFASAPSPNFHDCPSSARIRPIGGVMPYTFNGCGTRYYGNQDKANDGSYVTPEWITFVYLPLIPLRSFRVLPVGRGTNYVIRSSQTYQALRVTLRWSQVRNVYLFIAPIVLLIFYFIYFNNRQDIEDWVRYDILKQPLHSSLQAEGSSPPVEQPLNSKDAAVACGKILKLERPAYENLNIIDRLSAVVSGAGFTEQEVKDMGDSEKNLDEQAFKAYSFAYLTWDKPTSESRVDFDKMIVKVFNSQDLHTLSAGERAQFERYSGKVKRMMLQAFELGRHDARISPCPVSS
jgi:hypothetical protein